MKTIYLANGWSYIWPSLRRNTATGLVEVDAAHASLTATLSATDGGAAIHADLTKTLAERATTLGEYFAHVSGTTLTTHLTSIAASASPYVWEVVNDGTDVKYSVQRRVVTGRRP